MPTTTSRVLRFHETGEPLDVLREERTEVPDPPEGQVRVRVLATGLNPADWELCRGYLPGTLPRGIGYDVAGVVDQVGQGVERGLRPAAGDVVVGAADFLAQPSAGAGDVAILSAWAGVPDGLDPVQAAVLPMAVQTAAWTLDVMDVQPGTSLLVHGAGGMVGYAAVQIALRRGARVIATAGPTFTPDLEGFGARVTPHGPGTVQRVSALAGGDVDLVLDVPRPSPGTLPDLITLAGGDPARVMTISNQEEARALGARVNLDELTPDLTPLTDLLTEYASLTARGAFRLPVARAFPFAQWREAVQLSLAGAPRGKVVLLPGATPPLGRARALRPPVPSARPPVRALRHHRAARADPT